MRTNGMCRDELSRKVCGWLVRGGIVVVEDSSIGGADPMEAPLLGQVS